MADTKISGLSALTGANVDPAADIMPIVDTSVTTTKYITIQQLYNAASTLTALTGSGTDAAADSIPIYDNSATTEKRILVSELVTALGQLTAAVQANQETATSNAVAVTPGVQQYHPSACKAWGLITHATTVTVGYPGTGVSVVNNGLGSYTVTHGITFSSANYAVNVTGIYSAATGCTVTARTATTFTVIFYDGAGAAVQPTAFSYSCFGDI